MKKLLAISLTLLAILSTGCREKPEPITKTKPKELADPELTISGVPSSAIESGATFNFTISSKSEGEIRVSLDKPSFAFVESTGKLEYKVTAASASDLKVTIVVYQEAEGDYASAVKEASFKVTGSGAVALPGPNDAIDGTVVTYEESDGEVISPERGLYCAHEVHNSNAAITASDVKSKLATGHSLWLIEFYLTDFMSGSIYSSYLECIQKCFDAIRSGGAKAIVRFAYRADRNNPELMQDPEVNIVLKHVAQLKPILQKNEDVLFVLQAGFIGTWGEWYYTDHFSDFKSRKTLTEALLDAVPVSRQIQLRTPNYKMRMYNLSVADTLTAATAHDGSKVSRLAGHNDCFGADSSDEGTFAGSDTREFWKAETRYAIMGGETCKVSDYCLCPATLKDLEDYHWTYLHDGYNRDVLNRWQTDGCMDEIKARLGYRLVLKDVHYSALEAGKPCKVTIRLNNKGYAAPMNPRESWLVWITPDGKEERFLLGSDPRTWHSGYNAVVANFTPSTAKGTLYLALTDPLLPKNQAYNIVLANKGVFDARNGYNKLFEVK